MTNAADARNYWSAILPDVVAAHDAQVSQHQSWAGHGLSPNQPIDHADVRLDECIALDTPGAPSPLQIVHEGFRVMGMAKWHSKSYVSQSTYYRTMTPLHIIPQL